MSNMQKVSNWSDYNKSLRKRWEIIFSFDKNYYSELYYEDMQKRGGKRLYSDKMYEYLLTVKIMFRMPWRATIGFAGSILRKIFGEGISVPNYAHASRLCSKIKLKLKPISLGEGSIEIAFDITGVNVYQTSGITTENRTR